MEVTKPSDGQELPVLLTSLSIQSERFEGKRMNSSKAAVEALRRGEVIDLEGIKLKMAEGRIQDGDLYVAACNTGRLLLLTARDVVMTIDGSQIDFIFPTCNAYPFAGYKCVKVCEA